MAFFKSNAKEKEIEATTTNNQNSQMSEMSIPVRSTTISEGITVTGDLEGQDSIQIDGRLIGNLKVNEVTIGKRGFVQGSIIAKKVIISGELNGSIKCSNLDIMQTGKVSDTIHAKSVVINGVVTGEVIADNSVTITRGGSAKVQIMQGKRIIVNGDVEGKIIASELLDVGSNGCVQGEISVKNIKTEEGGKVIGTMAPYQEQPSTKQIPTQEQPKSEKKEEVIDAEMA